MSRMYDEARPITYKEKAELALYRAIREEKKVLELFLADMATSSDLVRAMENVRYNAATLKMIEQGRMSGVRWR